MKFISSSELTCMILLKARLLSLMRVLCRSYGPCAKHDGNGNAYENLIKQKVFLKNKQNNSCALRYKTLYISSPYSAKQQRVMNKFCVVWRTGTTTAKYFVFQLNAFVTHSAGASFNTDRHTGQFQIKIKTHFFTRRRLSLLSPSCMQGYLARPELLTTCMLIIHF